MVRRRQKGERGFALLIIVLIVALLAITAATLLDMVSLELDLVGQQRRILRARHVADGGIFESLGHENASASFPILTNPRIAVAAPGDANSFFHNHQGTNLEERYVGEWRLVRFSPVLDTSTTIRSATYELEIDSDINQGQASARSTVEIIVPTGKLGTSIVTYSHAR